jgi:hypothetical protein
MTKKNKSSEIHPFHLALCDKHGTMCNHYKDGRCAKCESERMVAVTKEGEVLGERQMIDLKPKSIYRSKIQKEMSLAGMLPCLMKRWDKPWYCESCVNRFIQRKEK